MPSSRTATLRSLWQTLADPTRLRVLSLLREEELSVAELQQVLKVGQSRISMHLAVLRASSLVQPRREGKKQYYRLLPDLSEKISRLLDAALDTLSEVPESRDDLEALRLALQKRRSIAQNYFNQIVGKMGRAHCPGRGWSAVGPLLAQLVPNVTIADLGAGEGWLSQLLAQHAEKVIAVDNSEKMVEFGKSEARKKKIHNLEYRLGDLASPPIDIASCDIVLLSQALHHAVNPAQAISAAAKLLKAGGRLVILDLNAHHFDQARELYGDYWLGFSETEIRRWLSSAGLARINYQLLPPEETPPKLQPFLVFAQKA